MKIICQIGVIFAVCWFSQLIEAALPVPFPASVIGMMLLLALLATGLLKIEHIREKADFLLANMAFFFIPSLVGTMEHGAMLKSQAVPILVIVGLTTPVVYLATAWTVQLMTRLLRGKGEKRHG